ncbi:TIGR00304 family membrane protein [Methanolobus sp. WCC5]|uniref:TIGR00304 family membrane protein n=1 Tax=Methanolobus sp. WCC5 TaxID=3125785 RepID=UPI003253C6C2
MMISSVLRALNSKKSDEYSQNNQVDFSLYSGRQPDDGYVSYKTDVKGGGIIMLGPIPVIFGSDSKSIKTLILLAIVLMLLYFLIFM